MGLTFTGAVEILPDSIPYYADLNPFVVSSIKWDKVPVEASGLYQCYDSSDASLPRSNISLIVPSKYFA